MTTVRVVYTVEYDLVEGVLPPTDDEVEELLFLQTLLDATPGQQVEWWEADENNCRWRLEPVGWGVQTDAWGDLWTGIAPEVRS